MELGGVQFMISIDQLYAVCMLYAALHILATNENNNSLIVLCDLLKLCKYTDLFLFSDACM